LTRNVPHRAFAEIRFDIQRKVDLHEEGTVA
jgi:hypothetical protein